MHGNTNLIDVSICKFDVSIAIRAKTVLSSGTGLADSIEFHNTGVNR